MVVTRGSFSPSAFLGVSDQIGNKGAFITLKEDIKPEFTTFDAVPHPDVKVITAG